jgi:hypothetical protein
MITTRLVSVFSFATLFVLDHTSAYGQTRFKTVAAMIESFGDYSEEGRTFKVISKNPLHIQLSPVVGETESPQVMQNTTKMTALYGLFRAFIHTPCEQITVTAFPKTLVVGDGTAGDYLKQYSFTVTATRKKALEVLQLFFPGKTFTDLVDRENQRTKIFDALSYPDQGSPGMDAVLARLKESKP